MTIREMMAMYHSLKFVEELIDYIEEYPDDDYMTMECLCRKLVKYHLMSKVDGYYTADRKTEPQIDCGDFADRLAYERGVKHAWEVAQKVFNSTVTFYEAEGVAKQIGKDEPQTYVINPQEPTNDDKCFECADFFTCDGQCDE